MPSRNVVKLYIENGYYHIYNRGVEKRLIFTDSKDYSVFLSYLKEALLPKNEKELYERLLDENSKWAQRQRIERLLALKNFSDQINLLSYCLMPNHFHLLIKQNQSRSIDNFTSSVMTRYTMYFNKKNSRKGPLFEGVYKAVLIESEEQLLHVSRYIHQNPLILPNGQKHQSRYTSLPEYLLKRKTAWIKPQDVLGYFSKDNQNNLTNSYLSFVEGAENLNLIQNLILEELE